jgi:two-component system NtrC family sensor kinase
VFTCIYALIVTVANDAFQYLQFSESIFFPLVFFFFVAIVFGPTQSLVQQVIDKIFRRERLNFHQSIQHISRLIVSSLEMDTITARLTTSVGNKLKIEHVRLFLKNKKNQRFVNVAASTFEGCTALDCIGEDARLICFSKKGTQPVLKKHLMERSDDPEIRQVLLDMQDLRAEIIFPLTIESRCIGFITLGEKKSGCLYTREEIDLLSTLSVQLSLAIENAQSYRRLDALNRNLEDRVRQRTLALQKALSEKDRSQEQLIRSESLAAIGQLVSGVAHELNNPLSAAISLIQSVYEDLDTINVQGTERALDDRLKGDIVFAEKELIRMKQIVASLLGLSRQTHTYTEAVNLNGVVHDALRVLQGYIRQHGITIEQSFAAEIPPIQGNFANLGQVAINIIKNACQAVQPSKGVLLVSTQYLKHAKQVVFSCQDNGAGIAASIRKDIFKPFFTTKAVGRGTGLGLYICHEIIRKHRGTITHENIRGKGALFRVSLPLSDE